MKEEFNRLYNDWINSYIWSYNPGAIINEKLIALDDWCHNHLKEAIQYIKELLLDEPNDIVIILPRLLDIHPIFIKSRTTYYYTRKKSICNFYINYISKTKDIDYYPGYESYRRAKENNLNLTYKEWKQKKSK